jgi:hypothetical protein
MHGFVPGGKKDIGWSLTNLASTLGKSFSTIESVSVLPLKLALTFFQVVPFVE